MTWLNYVWIAGGIVLAWITVYSIAEAARIRRQQPPAQPKRHPSDHWSGRCYRCGAIVAPEHATSIHCGGKPPKYFCPTCHPTLA